MVWASLFNKGKLVVNYSKPEAIRRAWERPGLDSWSECLPDTRTLETFKLFSSGQEGVNNSAAMPLLLGAVEEHSREWREITSLPFGRPSWSPDPEYTAQTVRMAVRIPRRETPRV